MRGVLGAAFSPRTEANANGPRDWGRGGEQAGAHAGPRGKETTRRGRGEPVVMLAARVRELSYRKLVCPGPGMARGPRGRFNKMAPAG